ncbi:probable bacteriophage protein STY1063 [plant metagenome]|uniref:Probable bacteriophage protein STY1063 n=1 Tax=plant metagenome TaxID=1297885 RepID=A0A484QHE9_9ZZZZ
MAVYEIPLSPTPQRFSILLGGTSYQLTLRYREGWFLDVADATGTPMLSGVPLVTGIDLLGQHRHLGFAGALRVQGAAHPDDVPTFDDLGVGAKLYWVTDDDG